MYETLLEILKKVASVDKRFALYPWAAKDAVGEKPAYKTLTSPDQLPQTWTQLKKYLPGIRPWYEGGTVYSSICMGTDKNLETIMEDVGHWFRHNSHGLYLKHIQAEVQYVARWLLYSTSNMDLR